MGRVEPDEDTAERRVVDHIRARLAESDTFPTRDLYRVAGVEFAPNQRAGESGEKFRKRAERERLRFASIMERAKTRLGEEFHLLIQATHRGSYAVVPHDRHLSTVVRAASTAIRKEIGRAEERVDWFSPRSEDDRKAKDSAAHQVGMMSVLMDRARKRRMART